MHSGLNTFIPGMSPCVTRLLKVPQHLIVEVPSTSHPFIEELADVFFEFPFPPFSPQSRTGFRQSQAI
jgi:hypothetical protein